MDLRATFEVCQAILGQVLPPLAVIISVAKAGAVRSLVKHLSSALWQRRMRKAGFSEKEIRRVLSKAALSDLSK